METDDEISTILTITLNQEALLLQQTGEDSAPFTQLALESGADPNLVTTENRGITPSFVPPSSRLFQSATLLLAYAADPTTPPTTVPSVTRDIQINNTEWSACSLMRVPTQEMRSMQAAFTQLHGQRGTSHFFFRPTPYGSRQVVYMAQATVFPTRHGASLRSGTCYCRGLRHLKRAAMSGRRGQYKEDSLQRSTLACTSLTVAVLLPNWSRIHFSPRIIVCNTTASK